MQRPTTLQPGRSTRSDLDGWGIRLSLRCGSVPRTEACLRGGANRDQRVCWRFAAAGPSFERARVMSRIQVRGRDSDVNGFGGCVWKYTRRTLWQSRSKAVAVADLRATPIVARKGLHLQRPGRPARVELLQHSERGGGRAGGGEAGPRAWRPRQTQTPAARALSLPRPSLCSPDPPRPSVPPSLRPSRSRVLERGRLGPRGGGLARPSLVASRGGGWAAVHKPGTRRARGGGGERLACGVTRRLKVTCLQRWPSLV
jgi:hypothetical protein